MATVAVKMKTPKFLRDLITSPEYVDKNSKVYTMAEKYLNLLYPGTAQTDATGRTLSSKPYSSKKSTIVFEKAAHIAEFIFGIWQIHPFREGNTRTTAVFAIKYLRSKGFQTDNELFKNNAEYFRNALVRANYDNVNTGILRTMGYLHRFFGNLLLGENNVLDVTDTHIDIANKNIKTREKLKKSERFF